MAQGDLSPAASGRLGQAGRLIDGRYRLEALLGAGGFGEVWRATQEVEGSEVRPVALKLLDAPPARPGETPERDTRRGSGRHAGRSTGSLGGHRWLDEVRAVRDVRCESIATIFDVGIAREPRVAFIAMELLRGETLDDRVARGRVYWRRALAIAREVARALVACHEVDVTHCDLKPANVFLDDSGGVYVLDFGVAALGHDTGIQRAVELAAAADGGSGDDPQEMGATGAVSLDELPSAVPPPQTSAPIIGTPGYIAPESYAGESPGPASDVYALGVVMARMIAGRLPHRFADDDAAQTRTTAPGGVERYHAAINAATVRGDLAPLSELAPDTPAAVCAFVDACLATDPRERPTADLLDALAEAWQRPFGVPDPPYVGLAAFDAGRAGYIHGRDADIEEVTAKLEERRAVVLTGPSGCGKSSLAVAGVAAEVDAALLDDTDGWRLTVLRPSEEAGVLRRVGDGDGGPSGHSGDGTGRLIVVDQLEEVLGQSEGERAAFCEALAALAFGDGDVEAAGHIVRAGAPARVIATVREDLFGPVAAIPELRRFPEQNLYTVRGVEPNAMGAIVRGPAEAAGYRLEGGDAVVAEAVALVGDDPGALPLVQFALTRWWEARDRQRKALVRAEWDKIGGIEGALAEAAQTLYERLSEDERERMRALLLALFRHDGTRVRVDEAAVIGGDGDRSVLERLVDRRLVTREESDRGVTLEVVHEALGHRWPLLHGWLEDTRAERELIHDAEVDAERWERAGRPSDLLWRGQRLAAAVEIRDDLGGARAFVDAAAAAWGRQRWTRRGTMAVLAGLVIVAGVLVLSWAASNRERERAEAAKAEAEAARVKEHAARMEVETQLEISRQLREEAEEARADAERENKAAEEARAQETIAREQAEEALAHNVELRRAAEEATLDAEAQRRLAELARKEAEEERAEAQKLKARFEEAYEKSRAASLEVDRQRRFARTAERLHELALERMAEREREFERERAGLETQLEQCRAGTR